MTDYGFGALQSPPDERDFPIEQLLGAQAVDVLPSAYIVPNRPPVLNQGATPQCVAYSTSAMKSYQDRDDQVPVRWWNFDEQRFFVQIGGTSQGAYLRTALSRLLNFGYPVVDVGEAAKHKIKAYYAVPTGDRATIKRALMAYGVLVMATPWYHSWMRPDALTHVLPRADYQVGGHAILVDGWDDSRGLRLRNSWGIGWGLSGDCFMPYPYVTAAWEIWKAIDTTLPLAVNLRVGDETFSANATTSPTTVTLQIGGVEKYSTTV